MVEQPPRAEDESRGIESILAKVFVEGILATAKENLKQDGTVRPILFVQFKEGERGIVPLSLPDTTAEKEAYFSALGLALRVAGQRIDAALFLAETWYVGQDQKKRVRMDIRPSRHPQRQEAITIVGRNADGSRLTMVVQPFVQGRAHHVVFGLRPVEEYNRPRQGGLHAVGLVDFLFPRQSGQERNGAQTIDGGEIARD